MARGYRWGANLWMLIRNLRELRRRERLNAALQALCVNAYLLRDWPVAPAVGVVVSARPMTLTEWLEAMAD